MKKKTINPVFNYHNYPDGYSYSFGSFTRIGPTVEMDLSDIKSVKTVFCADIRGGSITVVYKKKVKKAKKK